MRKDPEAIARDVLACALAWEPEVRIIGNVTAVEVALLAARQLMSCPKCGAEAWTNIDCDICRMCGDLVRGDFFGSGSVPE